VKDAGDQRMRLGHDALAVQRGHERDLEALDEFLHHVRCAAADRAVAGEQQHATSTRKRVCQARDDRLDARRIGLDPAYGEPDVVVVVDLHVVVGQVLGHVYVHWTGAAGERRVDRLFDDVAGIRDVLDDERLLGDGREHRLRVRRPVQP
jgi:hypothetical protein